MKLFLNFRKFCHWNQEIKWTESGRSMVEMIGVLAVVGLLSIAGITGLQYSLQLRAENDTVNAFAIAVTGAKTAELMETGCDDGDGAIADGCVIKPNRYVSVQSQFTHNDPNNAYFTTETLSPVQVQIEGNDGYTVSIAGISQHVCEQIKFNNFGETCALVGHNYTACGERPLADIDCGSFENAPGSRKSTLQVASEDESRQYTYADASSSYNSLILFFGNNGINLSEETDNDNNTDPGDDDDITDPTDPGIPGDINDPQDDERCFPNTPFLNGTTNEDYFCCKSAGGTWNNRSKTCCVGSNGTFADADDDAKSSYTILSNGLMGRKFVNGAGKENVECCEGDGSSEIKPTVVGGKNTVTEFCCNNAIHAGKKLYKWNSDTQTCCRTDVNGNLTGMNWSNVRDENCKGWCDYKCPNGTSPWAMPADTSKTISADNVFCCCSHLDGNGNENELCCRDWSDSVNGVSGNWFWSSTQNFCCPPNSSKKSLNAGGTGCCITGEPYYYTPSKSVFDLKCCEGLADATVKDGICCRKGIDVSTGKADAKCCNGTTGKDFKNVFTADCCQYAGGIWIDGSCCKGNTDITGNDNTKCNITVCEKTCPTGTKQHTAVLNPSYPNDLSKVVCCCDQLDENGNQNQLCCNKNTNNTGAWDSKNNICCVGPTCTLKEGCCSNDVGQMCLDGVTPDTEKYCTFPECIDGTSYKYSTDQSKYTYDEKCCFQSGGDSYNENGSDICCVSGHEISQVVPSSSSGSYSVKDAPVSEFCCNRTRDGQGLWVSSQNVCCTKGSTKTYGAANNEKNPACCEEAGGVWTGSFCCNKFGVIRADDNSASMMCSSGNNGGSL